MSPHEAEGPLVSVITAVYNCEAFLSEAIASVLAQTYTNWEYLLINDGSTDNTTAIACELADANPDRIHYLEHPGFANRGPCSSRNLGVAHARGQYIALLDADDVWLPNKLAEQLAIARRFPQAGLIHGLSEYWFDWTGNAEHAGRNSLPPLAPGDRLYNPPELLSLAFPLGPHGAPCPSDLLIASNVLREIGGFVEVLDRNTYEDQALLAKLYLTAPVYVSSRCWDRYRIHPNSSCAVAERTGQAAKDRRLYFGWLRDYLIAQKIHDHGIWRAWRRETLRYRHPLLHLIQRAVRGIRRRLLSP
jgi:glycosyltransferase involved in cell wall biosynthesis